MKEIVQDFLLITGPEISAPENMGQLIPYLMDIFTGVALVSGMFAVIGKILDLFLNITRWYR